MRAWLARVLIHLAEKYHPCGDLDCEDDHGPGPR